MVQVLAVAVLEVLHAAGVTDGAVVHVRRYFETGVDDAVRDAAASWEEFVLHLGQSECNLAVNQRPRHGLDRHVAILKTQASGTTVCECVCEKETMVLCAKQI